MIDTRQPLVTGKKGYDAILLVVVVWGVFLTINSLDAKVKRR